MNTHLTLEDRIQIQAGLKEGRTFTEIGDQLNKNKSTISREVKRHRVFTSYREHVDPRNVCVHRQNCDIKGTCHLTTCTRGSRRCLICGICARQCERFEEETCSMLRKAPHVCNGCKRRNCPLSHKRYDAKAAQKEYEEQLTESRVGISLNEEELAYVDSLVSPLLRKGHSIASICHQQKANLNLSEKTLYHYLELGLFSTCNLDLRRKVQRKPNRKRPGPVNLVDRQCREGRLYTDYLAFMEAHPDTPVVQMDSVEGTKGGPVLLTLLFVTCDLQLMHLRPRNNAASVTDYFHRLLRQVGPETFKRLFPVILTDRGSEFSDPRSIERDPETGERLTRVFFCDPRRSDQKAVCERNHEFIRYIVPKGTSFAPYDQVAVTRMMNHINSYGRNRWQFKAPLDIFALLYGNELLSVFGLKRIPDDQIILRPELIK